MTRKSKYEVDSEYYDLMAEGLAREGKTDKEIADVLELTEQTLNNWKNKYPAFFESLKKGKHPVDYGVENSLLKRAQGFEYTEVKTCITKFGDKEYKKVEKTVKYIPPDVGACCMWLKNRKPDKWRDKPQGKDDDTDNILKAYLESLKAMGNGD